jgi:hypothetical protein
MSIGDLNYSNAEHSGESPKQSNASNGLPSLLYRQS